MLRAESYNVFFRISFLDVSLKKEMFVMYSRGNSERERKRERRNLPGLNIVLHFFQTFPFADTISSFPASAYRKCGSESAFSVVCSTVKY